jgi:hypothetical protein
MLSFNACHDKAWANKRMILVHLVATSLLCGIRPRSELLQRYGLDGVYGPLLVTLPKGDLQGYKHALDAYGEWFTKKGLYVALRRCGELLCQRNVFRRVLVMFQQPRADRTGLYMQHLLLALRWISNDSTIEWCELESVVASLIAHGYMRGIMDVDKAYVALSKQQAFPPVSQVTL